MEKYYSLFIAPLLPTILLSIALGTSFLGLFGIVLLVYSFFISRLRDYEGFVG